MSGATFRKATRDDLEALIEIAQITQNEHAERLPQVFVRDREAASAAYMRWSFETANRPATVRDIGVIVAEKDGQILGYVAYVAAVESHGRDRHGVVGRIVDISIVPGHRGSGLGRQLLERATEALDEVETAFIRAEVWSGNTASERLFSGSGYAPHYRQFTRQLRPWIDGPIPVSRSSGRGRLRRLVALWGPSVLIIAGLVLLQRLLP